MKQKNIKKQVILWQKQLAEKKQQIAKIEKIITDLQDVCEHKCDDGTTAIERPVFDIHPDMHATCKICGKTF